VLCGWLTIVGLASTVQVEAAQESITESRPKFDFAIGTWISTGETRWEHDASASSSLFGNPTSKLKYKDVGTNVVDLAGTLWFTPKLFGRLNVGFASIGGGRLTDDDYLAADGGNPSSRTYSDLKGDGMWYLNADFGGRVTDFPNHRGWLDVFGGFQYWYTKYSAAGVGQVSCTSAGANTDLDPFNPGTQALCPNSVPGGTTVITNTTNWYSIRVGASTEYRLTRRLSLIATAAFIPLTIIDNEDIHHLRSDLQQNPSISMEGWGVGADGDVGLRLMLVKNIFLNVGYRVWWNHAIDGNVTFHGVNGSSEYPLTQFESFRQGLTAGLNFTF
jgi:hypothetical protein